ncbi:MAG: leucine dehydrogenase [Zetaproteobacteria bacterium]|nr:leucine dehydrogenase [Pseudobdellovibrionaceae bacterium]
MNILHSISQHGHEQLVFCNDKKNGLKAVIAIHDTTLGPSLGGCRFWDYKDENEAILDVLRLSRGMTYKAAIAGLNLGGGKSVIIGQPEKLKSRKFFHSFGKYVDSLAGRYITAEDVNIRVEDINMVAEKTSHVVGVTNSPNGSGDPSPFTALGVFWGIKAAAKHKFGTESLENLKIAVQGCGAVGQNLINLLHHEKAKVCVADLSEDTTRKMKDRYGVQVVSIDKIHATDCDIFAPCALGGILNSNTIPEIKAKIIAGGANNQLLDEKLHAIALNKRNILFAPDYVINAGGLINVANELGGYNKDKATKDTIKIYETLQSIFATAEKKSLLPFEASNLLAEKIITEKKKEKQN